MFKLRHYQQKTHDMISDAFKNGNKKVMVWAMTGAGKGFQMSHINNTALTNGKKVLNIMRRRSLIFQTMENYKKYHSIKSSPIMGNLKGQDFKNPCQIASIDTLIARIKTGKYEFLREYDLIVIDECHDFVSESYKKVVWYLEGFDLLLYSDKNFEAVKHNFKKYYIGLTATPFAIGNRTHTFWDIVVKPIEAHELRDEGVLVFTREFQSTKIDVKGIRINRDGDFNETELFERCTKAGIVGDVIETYKKHGIRNGKFLPAIYFCLNKNHAKIQTKAFNDAGIPARYCDDSHTQKEREQAANDLRNGVIFALLNVGIFSTGFDAPFIEVGGFLRPTESEALAAQQWGRILRPFKICAKCKTEYGGEPSCYKCGSDELFYEKPFAIILDHAGNLMRHSGKEMVGNSVVYAIREAELSKADSIHKAKKLSGTPKECPDCDAILMPTALVCEYCNYDFEDAKQDRGLNLVKYEGELIETNKEFLIEQLKAKIKFRFAGYEVTERFRRFNGTWKYYKIYDDFGDDIFLVKESLFIDDEKEKGLREYGKKKKEKELNENIEKLISDLNYKNGKIKNG